MSEDELEETRVLFVGAWDVLGRRGPMLFNEIKSLRTALASSEAKRDAAEKRLSDVEDFACRVEQAWNKAEQSLRESRAEAGRLREASKRAHQMIVANNSDGELNWMDDVREILFGALSSTPAATEKP